MPAKPPRIPNDLQQWITARKRHGLSHVHVQMVPRAGDEPQEARQPRSGALEADAAGRLACPTSLLLTPRSRLTADPRSAFSMMRKKHDSGMPCEHVTSK